MSWIERWLRKISDAPDKWIVRYLLFLLLFSIAGIPLLKVYGVLGEKSFGREVGKTLLQIIAVSVLGTIATLLLAVYNSRRTELQKEKDLSRIANENRSQFKKESLRRVAEAYSDVKRARRMLRAKAFTTPYYRVWNDDSLVILSIYDQYMAEINNAQLSLEIISREIKGSVTSFSRVENYQEISAKIQDIEECLKKLITEYEEKRNYFQGEPPLLAIKHLEKLKDFIGSEEKLFAEEFFDKAADLFKLLRFEILSENKNEN